jgi:hypothetical protein
MAGSAGRDFGEGNACEDKCSAGEDADACCIDGFKKLKKGVESGSLLFFPPSFALLIRGDGGEGGLGVTDSLRRKVTFNSKRFILDNSFGVSSSVALSFPFPILFGTAPNSSVFDGTGFTLEDRVAVRKLCSSVERMRLKVFAGGSGASGIIEILVDVDGSKREDEVGGIDVFLMWVRC